MDHVDHVRTQAWAVDGLANGWASCAITENGFVRVLGQPRHPSPVSPSTAVTLLARARAHGSHTFWPCAISILDDSVVNHARVHGHRQVTDAYLLALAVAHGGALVTFDRSLDLTAVRGAVGDHLLVL